MSRSRLPAFHALFPILLVLFVSSPAAALTIINFGPNFNPPNTRAILTDQLEEYGVVFSSPGPSDNVIWEGTNGQSSFPYVIHTDFGPPKPLRIDFVDPLGQQEVTASLVQLYAVDGGGDLDVLTLRAFNRDDELLAFDVYGPGPGDFFPPEIVRVETPNISYVTLEVTNTTSGLFYQNLQFELVPEPNTALLLSLGLVGLAINRRPGTTPKTY